MNRKLFVIAISFISTMWTSCEKYKNPIPDFQNTLPSYVQITNKANKTVKQSAAFTVTIASTYGFGEDITINYEVKGLTTMQGNVVLPKFTRSVVVNLTAPSTPQALMFTLTGTSSPKLAIGKLSATSEVVKITVTP